MNLHSESLKPRLAALLLAAGAFTAPAAELIHQEGFNDDGSKAAPPRYTVVGGDVWELSRIFGDPPLASASAQRGPVYFAHNFDVSFVGIPNIPARRMMFCWRASNDIANTTEEFLKLWDSSVAWLLKDKANATVMVYPTVADIGGLGARLTAAGHTVVDDDPSKTDAQLETIADLFIHAGSADPSRYALIKKPAIGNISADWDDLILGSIGADATFAPGQVNIASPGHPAAGGKTGSFAGFAAATDQVFALAGRFLPDGSTTLATVNRTVPPSVVRLSDVDDMIAGTKQHEKTDGTLATLDVADAAAGNWPDDNAVPGGYSGSWGLRVQGKVSVSAPGTYRFALGTDDGARFQIDRDKNGFTAADNIIEDLGPHGHTIVYANVTFSAAGTYDFEVRAYNAGTAGDFELSAGVVPAAEILDDDLGSGYWEVLGTAGSTAPVKLSGTATATGYMATGASTETKEPLIVLLNGPDDAPPGAFYGGGPLANFEGTGYFAGAGMNKFPYQDATPPRSVTLRPVNVAGKSEVKLTVALAAAQIDFENDANDFLDINIYPNGAGSTRITLAHFNGVENGRQPWLADDLDGNQRRLTREFADFTYNIPAGATDLIVEFVAGSSWWNELLGFDNVRITSGALSTPLRITSATKAAGNALDVVCSGGTPPFLVQGTTALPGNWVDLYTAAGRTFKMPLAGAGATYRLVDATTKNVLLYTATLTGAAERPDPVVTPATGEGWAALDGDKLTWYVAYRNLKGPITAAHLHGPADANGAAPPLVDFMPATGPTSGVISGSANVNQAVKDALAQGRAYFNLHSSIHGGGEIRGQLGPN
ncbi:MAG: CHRD domain-containing protein [Limisphaerales bacterium]